MADLPFLAVLCCTYLRPSTLGEMIASYCKQDYPLSRRELVVLDDAGQYRNESGVGWRIVSVPQRYSSLGEKRNAVAAMMSPGADAIVVADDDEIYLPHWLSVHASALQKGDWSVPGQVLVWEDGQMEVARNFGTYHSGWAYRTSLFRALGGYAPLSNGEDQEFAQRAVSAGFQWNDPCANAPPYLISRRGLTDYQMSDLWDSDYERLVPSRPVLPAQLQIRWDADYQELARSCGNC